MRPTILGYLATSTRTGDLDLAVQQACENSDLVLRESENRDGVTWRIATNQACYEDEACLILRLDGDCTEALEREQALHIAGLLDEVAERQLQDCGEAIEELLQSGSYLYIDKATGQLLATAAFLNTSTLQWSECKDGFRFCNRRCGEFLSPGGSHRIDEQALYHYLYFHIIPAPFALTPDSQRIRSGNMLKLGTNGAQLLGLKGSLFDAWTRSRQRKWDRSAGTKALRSHLREAVGGALETAPGKVGAFLSGGLDSSTVTGMLAEHLPGNAHAFSIGFSATGYDEMEYARLAAEHFGVTLHEYYVTPDDIVDALPRVTAAYDLPFGNSSALPAYFCAKLAKDSGFDVLLAGDGGDELFAGNERYAQQGVFENFNRLPALLRDYAIEPAAHLLPAGTRLGDKARSFLRQANTPLPMRLQYYNFFNQFPLEQVVEHESADAINVELPTELLQSVYNEPRSATTLDRMLYMDWELTLTDNDLVKVNTACELAGINVRYPMLDSALVKFSASIPDHIKLPRGQLRAFYKNSLRGWLPDTTIDKSKHGFGLPFGVWLREHKGLRELAGDNLQRLAQRGIVKKHFINDAMDKHQSGHASYFGELVWLLLVLELWLQANPDVRLGSH